ncbi:tetratricopeptide repeat protein [Streptomyces sp. NBC_01799]|uniref:tetratricopeptide repeat protein n=1 Tax=Streptomyces sp. NBC_01800 TaxID=2975945 RepID=UPI002DDAE929|nr:tetratricopeptide repeat protein [Streptomyces sp. NBC_01800]WSA70831.1 tetratricopeptide repeat protein [Streptomyces sp. NBC_01800]WSA79330.1 tetratricopeptide repeat protein [Streptomyces sp. NBC_01799]
MSLDIATIRQALRDNYEEPEGPARNARAERLLTEAEGTGDAPLLVEALANQLQAYNYSSEKDKMFVPFARLLRMWDEQPGSFDQVMTHHLFWMFKWVSSSMINQPHIPLASIEKWQGEMAHRYRLAGHSERAVRQGELQIARHLGDLERAERAYTAWQAADRDRMANCHACELHSQGAWQVHRGQDEEALHTWRPVLDGEHTCAHEPHAVLAASLLPLLRTGRTDQARGHHLRGYRMIRPMESMRDAVALHIEFCALTGNEARALEILAERPAYFSATGNPDSLMDFLAVTALLMDRLTALGHDDQSVPGPAGTDWTARSLAGHAREQALALAARFDERNGNTQVSDVVRERLAQQPLLDRLPLGLRAPRPAAAARKPAAEPGTAVDAPLDPAGLLAEARRLSDAQHPDAGPAWQAAARAAEGSRGLSDHDRACIDDHRARDGALPPAVARGLFLSAAELYGAAGVPGEAVAAAARGAYVRSLEADHAAEALAEAAVLVDRALALHTAGRATGRQAGGVLVCRARILNQLVLGASDESSVETAVDALEQGVRELLAFTEPLGAQAGVATGTAEALGFLGDIAAYRGDGPGAGELYARAAAETDAAGLPWYSVAYETEAARIAVELRDHATAEHAARAALAHGAFVPAPGRARLHLQLAEVLGGIGEFAEASEQALDAAHWADEAGESDGLGVHARHLLGGWLLQLGRAAEAAAVLEAVLPDITAEDHGDGMVVQTLWWLGDALTALGEPREAAGHWLKAADIARTWPEQHDHAMLANLAGQALYQGELNSQAEKAYARAGELWRQLGDVHALVRTLRVRAWIAVREGQPGPAAARTFMAAAERQCEAALAAAEPGQVPGLRAELADTHRQTGELIANACEGEPDEDDDGSARSAYEEALAQVDRAVTGFTEAGPDFLDRRTAAELVAAWLEADLGRRDGARARARGVLAVYEGTGAEEGDTVHARRAEAESVLGYVDRAPHK